MGFLFLGNSRLESTEMLKCDYKVLYECILVRYLFAHEKWLSFFAGTIITEWDDGKELCKRFLASREICELFVDKLVQMASAYRFDGWLINIENDVEVRYQPRFAKRDKI